MQNRRSRLEKRLARLLAPTPLPAAQHTSGHPKIDLVYPAQETREHLPVSLRE